MEANPFNPSTPETPSVGFDVRRQELSPQVRSYVDNLYVQIRQIFDKYGVANIEDLRDGVKDKRIKMESKDGERLKQLTRWLRDTLKERRIPEGARDKKLEILAETLTLELDYALNNRFVEFGSEHPQLIPPELPPGLTMEHLDAIKETFPGAFEERILPRLEELFGLDDDYLDVMYPNTQSERDELRGLVTYRPKWWYRNPYLTTIQQSHETQGEAYVSSMSHELKAIGGSLVLLDTATKPRFRLGTPAYGTVEGDDLSKDPLIPLFHEAFGTDANRYMHSWDELNDQLLPLAKKKIEQSFRDKNLPIPSFEVMLVPAVLDNIEMTLKNPESSSTNTCEWTSTIVLDDDGKDSGYRLGVGNSERNGGGGASYVDYFSRTSRHDNRGVRLAIVFKTGIGKQGLEQEGRTG